MTYLVANNLRQVQLLANINDMLELPTSDIAHTNVVDLPREDKVMEGPQSLFYWCATIPAVCLVKEERERKRGEGRERGGREALVEGY